jgi:hypothetical protein
MDDETKKMLDEIQTASDRKLLVNLTLARVLYTLTGIIFSYFFTLLIATGFYSLSCFAMGIVLTPGDALLMLTVHLVVFKLMVERRWKREMKEPNEEIEVIIDAIKAERKRRRDGK